MDRLTKKDRYGHFYTIKANCRNVYSKDGENLEGVFFENQTLAIDGTAIERLGKIEDLMEKYNVKDLEELDKLLTMATSYEELSKQVGCPLEVYVKLRYNTPIFDESGCWGILNYIDYNEKLKVYYMEVVFFSKKEGCKNYVRSFLLADYKKTWFLRKDKSE